MLKEQLKSMLALFMASAMLVCAAPNAFAAQDEEPAQAPSAREFNHIVPDDDISEFGYQSMKTVDNNGNEVKRQSADISDRDIAKSTLAGDYPAEYNSLGVVNSVGTPIITPIKDQGYSGNCWAFAHISMAETAYIRKQDVGSVNFSEAHLAYFSWNSRTTDPNDPMCLDGMREADPYNLGGNVYFAGGCLARWAGPEHEAYLPPINWYGAYARVGYSENMRYISEAHITRSVELNPKNVAATKEAIMTYGSVLADYYSTSYGYNYLPNAVAFYQNMYDSFNHEVVIIGWNDNFSRWNFNGSMTPPGNGAWLVKNSWAEDWGSGGGYFWMSYYERSLVSARIIDFDPIDVADNNYSYDGDWANGLTYFWFPDFGSGHPIHTANVFTAKSDETLTEVGYYSLNTLGQLTVRVYVDPNEGDPMSGTFSSGLVTHVGEGYYNITLNDPVKLKAGQKFSVVMEMINLVGGQYSYAVEEINGDRATALPGQTYYLDPEEHKWYPDKWNALIKAFTVSDTVDKSDLVRMVELCDEFGIGTEVHYYNEAVRLINDENARGQEVRNAYKRLYELYRGQVGNSGFIKFDPVLPVEDVPETISYRGGQAVIPEVTPEYPGWAFVGWSISGAADVFFKPGQLATSLPGGDITLKGVWRTSDADGKLPTGGYYTVYYHANGGKWSANDTSTLKIPNSPFGQMTFGMQFNFPSETATLYRDGYRLHTDAEDLTVVEFRSGDGNGNTTYNDPDHGNGYEYELYSNGYKSSVFMVNTDRVPYGNNIFVYACWDPIVTYNLNDGSESILDFNYITDGDEYTLLSEGDYTRYSSSSEFNAGDENNTLLANREGYKGRTQIPEKVGYVLAGWNTEADGTGTFYAAGETIDVTEPVSLYAMWMPEGDHEHEYIAVTTDATCTEDGSVVYTCICGDNYSEIIPAKGHAWGEWRIIKEATALENGEERRTCANCGETESNIIPATGYVTPSEVTTKDMTVSITNASDVKIVKYAKGSFISLEALEEAGAVTIANLGNGAVDNVYSLDMTEEGKYTFWVQMIDGRAFFNHVEVKKADEPVVSDISATAEGAVVTVSGLNAEVKDIFLALGEYNNYTDVNNNKIVRITQNKLQGAESYDYTVPAGGVFTVLVRYNDGTMKYLYVTVNVIVPEISVNGLQVTVSNLEGVKVIRTAYGEYKTAAKIKAAEGARAFTAKGVLKGVDQYTIQYRDNGIATIAVCYENGYMKIFVVDIQQKVPTFTQDGNIITFGNLDDLKVIRYAKGEYTTSAQIKNATGSVAINGKNVTDDTVTVTLKSQGTYTFCVQYNDESYNFYTVTVE